MFAWCILSCYLFCIFYITIVGVLLYHLSLYIAARLAVFNAMLSWCVIAWYPNTLHYCLRCIIVSAVAHQIIFSWYVTSLLMVDYIMLSCCVNLCHHGILRLHVIMLSCYHVIMVIMISYYTVAIHAVWMTSWYKIHFNIYMMSLLMVY